MAEVVTSIELPATPAGVAIAPSSGKLFATLPAANQVAVLDALDVEAEPALVPVGEQPAALAGASDVVYVVNGGEVTLSGTLDSRQARRRAEDLAEQISGVSYVQNNIRVRTIGGSPTTQLGAVTAGAGSVSPNTTSGGTTFSGRTVELRYNSESRQLSWTGPAAKTETMPAGYKLDFLAPESASAILLGGQLVETGSVRRIRFFPDGTCDPFRARLQVEKNPPQLFVIDPWTCALSPAPAKS